MLNALNIGSLLKFRNSMLKIYCRRDPMRLCHSRPASDKCDVSRKVYVFLILRWTFLIIQAVTAWYCKARL
jgi:hypothetical protein